MNSSFKRAALLAGCALSLFVAASATAQLEPALKAHGGLEKWRSYGAVEFDHTWTSKRGVKKEHQVFDLRSRDGLITSDNYTLGATGGEVWIKPSLDALGGTPPRFYIWTPFYFFAMPFVLADPGARQESLGKKMFQGREFDAVKVTFEKGTGDSADDSYVAYINPESGELKLVIYVVTYPALRKDKPIDQLKPNALVFEEWQDAGGLRVLKRGSFYDWKNETIEGEPGPVMEFANVQFSDKQPDQSKFGKPADAVIAPLD